MATTATIHRLPVPLCGAQPFPGTQCCDRLVNHDGPHHGIFEHLGEYVWLSSGEMLREYHISVVREQRRQGFDPDKRKAGNRAAARAWKARNPERVRMQRAAQLRVFRAIRDGRLNKPSACEQCGTESRLEAAHSDYAQPLEVRWLCHRCHRAWDHAAPKTAVAS